MTLSLREIEGPFAVCRLEPGAPLPGWFRPSRFASVSWNADELSITCDEALVPEDVQCERGWRCLMLQGPFAFDQTGILLQVLAPLATARIGIFAVSTFDTDYVLIKSHHFESARKVLAESGLRLLD